MNDTFQYRLTKSEKTEIAENLIEILQKDAEIKQQTSTFISNWILTTSDEKRKAFFGTGLAGGFTTMSALTLFIDNQGLSPEIALLLFIGPATYAFGWHQGRRRAKKVGHE